MARPNPVEGAQEVQRMLIDYAKQETIEPLKHLGRYLGLGIAGAILMFMGVFFVGLATLRLLQSLDAFEGGSWMSTLPYLVAIVVLVVAIGLIYLSLSRARRKVLS
ncbi:MAG: phage holin family protein [Actinomycetota bacterium]